MQRSTKLIASGAILALAVASIAIAAGSPGKRFAEGSDRGQNPLAEAAGQTKKPKKLYARVSTSPQGAEVGAKYTTKCVRGSKLGTRGDTFAGTAPVTKKLRMRFNAPDLCQASILTRMKGNGTVKVVLRAKKQ